MGGSLSQACKEIKVVTLSQRGIFRKDVPSNHDAGSGPHLSIRSKTMRFYNRQHQFYCGIDLHARLLAVCVLDQAGNVVCQTQIAADKQLLLDTLAPFRTAAPTAMPLIFGAPPPGCPSMRPPWTWPSA
jgi:hypothetical protein